MIIARHANRSNHNERTGKALEPAHALYLRNGFEWSGPFGEYTATEFNVFMVKVLV